MTKFTLGKTKFKVRILYNSGNSIDFWCTKFEINKGSYSSAIVGDVFPITFNSENIEATYQVDYRVNLLQWIFEGFRLPTA